MSSSQKRIGLIEAREGRCDWRALSVRHDQTLMSFFKMQEVYKEDACQSVKPAGGVLSKRTVEHLRKPPLIC